MKFEVLLRNTGKRPLTHQFICMPGDPNVMLTLQPKEEITFTLYDAKDRLVPFSQIDFWLEVEESNLSPNPELDPKAITQNIVNVLRTKVYPRKGWKNSTHNPLKNIPDWIITEFNNETQASWFYRQDQRVDPFTIIPGIPQLVKMHPLSEISKYKKIRVFYEYPVKASLLGYPIVTRLQRMEGELRNDADMKKLQEARQKLFTKYGLVPDNPEDDVLSVIS